MTSCDVIGEMRILLVVFTLLRDVTSFSSANINSPQTREAPAMYSGDSANISLLLENILRGYDKRLRPNYKGDPVQVGITLFVFSVGAVSEANMDFTVEFYFRQHWEDSRLSFHESEEELCISNEMLDKIWWPDTFFTNAKSARFHTATTKNAFVRIKPNGWITQSLRLTVTAMCSMDLTFFPLDTQECALEIESYAYSVKHIAYQWHNDSAGSVTIAKDVQLPQFNIIGYRTRDKLQVLTTGNYSRLACEFLLVRSLGYYIIQIYVPSSLIVVLSWISFWLHRDAAPARVALGITTVLTMTTLISNTNSSLPKISYLKSIDVYLVTCFVMVFAAILEYAAVSYISNAKPSWKSRNRNFSGELRDVVACRQSGVINRGETRSRRREQEHSLSKNIEEEEDENMMSERESLMTNQLVDDKLICNVNQATAKERLAALHARTFSLDLEERYVVCNNAESRQQFRRRYVNDNQPASSICNCFILPSRTLYSLLPTSQAPPLPSTISPTTSQLNQVRENVGSTTRARNSCVGQLTSLSQTERAFQGNITDMAGGGDSAFRRQGISGHVITKRESTSGGHTCEHVGCIVGGHVSDSITRFCSSSNCRPGQRPRGGQFYPGGRAPIKNSNITLATSIDRNSRVVFPVLFTALNVIYWTVYLNIRPKTVPEGLVLI